MGFLERRLSPLDEAEIRCLLRQWFSAAHRAESGSRRRHRNADQEYEELWGKLEANHRLFDMATNPLLLTSMAVLVHGGDPLPPERAKIYQRLISLTLVRWREAQIRAGQPPESVEQPVRLYAEESDDDVRLRLQQFGAWMLQHQRREILLREAQDLLAPVYTTNRNWLPERSRNHVQALLRLLALHSGLIQERDQGYSFFHFTLQEYLTARDYDERGDVEGLLQMWREPRWRETILLAEGHWATSGYRQRAQELLEALLGSGEVQALFLAAEALDEANARLVTSLLGVLNTTVERLRALAFDPLTCPDPHTRNQAAGWLDRLGADNRPALDLLQPEYWAEPIAPGPFLMGDGDESFAYDIRHPYALGRFPVTNRQYALFLGDLERSGKRDEVARRRPRDWPGSHYRAGEGNHPVVAVDWRDATVFAAWADQFLREQGILKDGEQVRLPTEPEWERAAAYPIVLPANTSGADRRAYPWGAWPSDESAIPANIDENLINNTSVVGIFPQGAATCGAQDMAGNVWEWCSNFEQKYPLLEEVKPETLDSFLGKRTCVLRGGSWSRKRSQARCAYRYVSNPANSSDYSGFRLVRLSSSTSS